VRAIRSGYEEHVPLVISLLLIIGIVAAGAAGAIVARYRRRPSTPMDGLRGDQPSLPPLIIGAAGLGERR
jgi:hypothetical protein